MRDITTELKELRLHGMAGAWDELTTHEGKPNDVGIQTSRWLIEHLLQAEHAQRAFASVRHQMKAAKFPLHRDLAGFDFEGVKVDQKLVKQLATLDFTDSAQNAVLIGGPGTGKTHLATAIGVAGIAAKGKRVRFYSTVDLVNELEKEKREGKAGRIALALMRMDLVILDELGYLPFSQAGGALLFHLLSKLYEHTSVVITTNLSFSAMVGSVWRRQDDDSATGPAHPPLPHRGDGQRVLPVQAQHHGRQDAHQGSGECPQRQQGYARNAGTGRIILMHQKRGKSATGYALCSVPLPPVKDKETQAKTSYWVHLSTVADSKIGNPPWLIIESAGWLNIQSAPTWQSYWSYPAWYPSAQRSPVKLSRTRQR